MKTINYLLLISTFILANPFDKWVDKNKHIIKEKVKTAIFQITIKTDLIGGGNKILDGKIVVGENKQFRFEMGPRTVVSDGMTWQSYDDRTDQIFIQEPDKNLEKALFSWVKVKKLKALPVKNKSDGSCKINLFGKENDMRAYFNSNSNELDSIIITQQDGLRSKISNIILMKADTVILEIGTEHSTSFDLR